VLAAPRAIVLAFCLAAGCGPSGPKVYTIQGTVTYKGNPVPQGVINFEADPRQGNAGPQGCAVITDGRYTTADVGGRGVVAGAVIVKIDCYDGQPARELPLGKPLARGYETLRVFEAADQTQNFDVP